MRGVHGMGRGIARPLVLVLGAALLVPVATAEPAQANAACSPANSISGQYVVVQFTATVTCNWTAPGSGTLGVEYLIVGGGGGGGGATNENVAGKYKYGGGGGGAGGLRTDVAIIGTGGPSIIESVIVGAGGAGRTSTGSNAGAGTSGSPSSAFGRTVGGGGGGGRAGQSAGSEVSGGSGANGGTGDNGGSGGGGGGYLGTGGSAGSGTSGQGWGGGAGGARSQDTFSNRFLAHGGGGGGVISAGTAGGLATTLGKNGKGGSGRTSDITGSSVVYAKGGDGGEIGLNQTGSAGDTPGTGGGGGNVGAGEGEPGHSSGDGANGIVVVRYFKAPALTVTRDKSGAVTFATPALSGDVKSFEYNIDDSATWTNVDALKSTRLSPSDNSVKVQLRAKGQSNSLAIAGGDVSSLTIPRPAAPSGVAMVGSQLTAPSPTINGVSPSYQWQSTSSSGDVTNVGTNSPTYVATAADQGKTITVELSYAVMTGTVPQGSVIAGDGAQVRSSVTVSSAETAEVLPFSPTSLSAPSGTPQIDQTLTKPADDTTLATGVTRSYEWLADGLVISGATGTTYKLTTAQAGKAIRVRVKYTAADNTEITTLTSGPTTPVLPGVPTFSGTAQVGAQLTAADFASVPGAQAYRWQVWDAATDGNLLGTSTCFTTPLTRLLTSADQGKYIALVAFSDALCTGSSNTSTRSTQVAAFAPTSISAPSGDAKVGGRLSVPADASTTVPGVTRAFQWYSGDDSISGATDDTYLIRQADEGKTFSVAVTYRATDDSLSLITTLRSPSVGPVAPFDPATIAAPSGTAMVGSRLTVSAASSVTGVTPSYEWLADGQPGAGTVGADPSTYVVGALDAGKKISVRVTYRNGSDVVATRTSAETLPVMAFAPTTIAAPTGVAQVGQTLTAAAHATTATGVTYSYQWWAGDDSIVGATASTFVPTAAQVRKAIRVVVSYTAAGQSVPFQAITSAATSAVIPGIPTFSGAAQVGAQLTADTLPSGAQAYKWQTWDAASGGVSADLGVCVTSLTRVLTATELGKFIGLNAYPNADCTGAPSSSSRLGPVVAFAPTAVGAPTGVVAVGSRLQVNPDAVTSVPEVTYSYQWLVDGTVIQGATDDSILLTDGYAGRAISVTVTYTAADGTTQITSITSAATAPVAAFSPASVGAPTGTAMRGSLLTVNPDAAPADPALTRSYQWQSTSSLGSVTNVGSDSPTYVATASDVDDTISVVVTYRNGSNVVATRTSAATTPVLAFAPSTIAAPTGVAQVGQTLTVSPLATTATGVTYTYQWLVDGAVIPGATDDSILLTDGYAGKAISVTVTYQAADGTQITSITSAATDRVVPLAPSFTGTARVGSQLTAAALSGGARAYRWQVWDAATGGNLLDSGSCFTAPLTRVLTSAQQGKFLALVAYSDTSCLESSTSSARSAQVAAFSPSAISAPTGTVMLGSRLTVAADAATNASGVTLSYQWRAGGAVVGSNSSTYIIAAPALVDDTITVTVTYTAANGTAITSITSAPTGPVVAFAPTSIGPPSGAPMVGSRLSPPANAGTLATGVTAHYRWHYKRGQTITPINAADDDTFVIAAPVAVGDAVLVEVTYKDANGTVLGTPVMGASSDPVTAFSPTSIGPPSGIAMVGSRLSPPADAATSAVGVTATYVWTRTPPGGTPTTIPGATGSTYVLTPDDLDDSIAVTMTYFDADGNQLAGPVVGLESDPVVAFAPTAIGVPVGSTRVGSTLSVNPDAATSAVGVALSYQWMVDGQDVQGATGSTMTLTSAHAGKVVAVKVTYTAANGSLITTLTSPATGRVTFPPPRPRPTPSPTASPTASPSPSPTGSPSPSPTGSPSPGPSPSPAPPGPAPEPVPSPVAPGEAVVLVDGQPDASARVEPIPGNDGIAVSGDGWIVRVQGLNSDGQPQPLAPNESLVVDAKREVGATGTGFQPGTSVALYLNPPVGPATATGTWWRGLVVRMSTMVSLGSIAVRADGTFDGMATLPASVLAGDHALQAIGLSPTSQTRAVVVGLVVQPWIILDNGKRKSAGRHDVIRTRGDSGGLKPGDVLRPHVRFQGQKAFVPGVASIVIRPDGTFTWQRKVRPGKPLTAYTAWKGTRSNLVHWSTVRT